MKIYKNHAQLGHYYIIDEANKKMAEIVLGSSVYLHAISDYEATYELLEHEKGIPGWGYDFEESNFLDILVVTGISKAKIMKALKS